MSQSTSHSHPFSYHFDVPSVSTTNADLASGSLISLPVKSPRKVVLLERSRPYSIRIVKKPEVSQSGSNQPHQQQYYGRLRLGLVEPDLLKAEVELVKTWALSHRGERIIELQSSSALIEKAEGVTTSSASAPTSVKAEPETPPSPSPPLKQHKSTLRRRAASKMKMKHKHSKKRAKGKRKLIRGGSKRGVKNQNQQHSTETNSISSTEESGKLLHLQTSATSLASTGSSTSTSSSSALSEAETAKSMEVIATSLAHPAYINQCIVLLDFEDASFAEVIAFKFNCVSSQFSSLHRGKLSLILEIFAYDLPTTSTTSDAASNLSRSGSTSSTSQESQTSEHRRVDIVAWPLFILWPGGVERRLKTTAAAEEADKASKVNLQKGGGGSLLKIKDEQLEALHDSLQVLPGLGSHGHLPPYYWDLVVGRGLFAAILEAPASTVNGAQLTYLVKGTAYLLRLRCFNFVPSAPNCPVKLRSVISLRLKGPGVSSVADETERFTNWVLMSNIGSRGSKAPQSPMLEVDYGRCLFSSDPPVAVLDVSRPGFGSSSTSPGNSLSLLWSVVGQRPTEEVDIAFQLNVTSAAFFGGTTSSSNVHFSLTVDTFNDSFEGQARQIDSLSTLVVVVQEGAEENQNKVTGTPSQPSTYNVTLLRTGEEFTVKVLLFIAFEPECLEYRPLLLFNLEQAHFHQSLVALVRKAAPKMLPKISSFIGEVFVVGLPTLKGSNVNSGSAVHQPLSGELIVQLANCHAKALFKCVAVSLAEKDAPFGGQVDLTLVFQSGGL